MHQSNSTAEVIEVLTAETTKTQNVEIEDLVIAGVAASARRLGDEEHNNMLRADNHFVQQARSEDGMNTADLKVQTASNDEQFTAGANDYERLQASAEDHNTAGHNALTEASDDGAKAAALERISEIRKAVIEEEKRITFAKTKTEIEDSTREGVKEEMKLSGAVQPAENLEAGLELLAKGPQGPSSAAPGA